MQQSQQLIRCFKRSKVTFTPGFKSLPKLLLPYYQMVTTATTLLPNGYYLTNLTNSDQIEFPKWNVCYYELVLKPNQTCLIMVWYCLQRMLRDLIP